MSVTLNEVALRALLSAEQGPVFRDIERRAERARDALQARMDSIIAQPGAQPHAAVEMTPEGAVVGIVNTGRVSEYLDFKLGEREPWWEPFGKEPASGSG